MEFPPSTISHPDIAFDEIGVIIVDHGSRRAESNDLLLEVVALFSSQTSYKIVEPAHMELASPTLAEAFERCVRRGAKLVIVHPYFLLPGRHWDQDIPALAAAAAKEHPGVRCLVTAPLGLHPLMIQIMDERIRDCLSPAPTAEEASRSAPIAP